MSFTRVTTAVFLTITYSAQFDFPLTTQEIYQRLVILNTKDSISFSQVTQALTHLVRSKKIETAAGFYALKDIRQLVQLREKRAQFSAAKRNEAHSFITEIQKYPWIQAVGLTGSVAVNNANADDDIDFIIITQHNRLWLTRLVVAYHAWRKGKLRSWQAHEHNSWCFNLWLDETAVRMPPYLHTVYGAYELCQTDWLYIHKEYDIQTYYSSNKWVNKYIPHFFQSRLQHFKKQKQFSLKIVSTLLNPFVALLELIAYLSQKMYMSSHHSQERVTQQVAFFHPRNTKKIIYEAWKNQVLSVQ